MAFNTRPARSVDVDLSSTPLHGPSASTTGSGGHADLSTLDHKNSQLEELSTRGEGARESIRPRYGGKGVPALRPSAVDTTSTSATTGSLGTRVSDSSADEFEDEDDDIVESEQSAESSRPTTKSADAKTLLTEIQQEKSTSMEYLMKRVQAHDKDRGLEKSTG